MNPDLSNEVLKKLIEWLEGSKDFVTEQAPSLIQETIRYHQINSILGIFIFIVVFFAAATFFIYHWAHPAYTEYNTLESSTFLCLMFGGMITLFSFILLVCQIDDSIKIRIAPKYFLVQKFSKIIKGSEK